MKRGSHLRRVRRWSENLTEPIHLKDGGILRTLQDAARFASTDNPFEQREAWQAAARKLIAAAESGAASDIKAATNQVVHALIDDGRLGARP